MFGALHAFKRHLTRAARLLRAFALLEEPSRSTGSPARMSLREHTSVRSDGGAAVRASTDCTGDAPASAPAVRPDAHRLTLDRAWHTRRAGATPSRPSICLTPVARRTASTRSAGSGSVPPEHH
jgi:hypothetical protein